MLRVSHLLRSLGPLSAAIWLAGQASAQVFTSCSASASPVTFPAYNAFSGSAVDSATNVNVTCTGLLGLLVTYDVELGGGGSGSIVSRLLFENAGSDQLAYQLYTNSSRTQVWGDGIQGATFSGSFLISIIASFRTHTAYGRIPASQVVNAGDYSDTLVMTVVF